MNCLNCHKEFNQTENIVKYEDGVICRDCLDGYISKNETDILWDIILCNIEKMSLKALLKLSCSNISQNKVEIIFKNSKLCETVINSDKKQCLYDAIYKVYGKEIEIIIKTIHDTNKIPEFISKDSIDIIPDSCNVDFDLDTKTDFRLKEVDYNFWNILPSALYASVIGCIAAVFFSSFETFGVIIITIITLIVFHYNTFISTKENFLEANKMNIDTYNKMRTIFENIRYYNNVVNNINLTLKNNLMETIKYSADLIADIETIKYELSAKFLTSKKRPAFEEAKRIKELRKETKLYISEYKKMRHEYDVLFSLFPELENYLEYYSGEKSESIEEIKENYDYVQSWISKDEYNSLDENTRNQLALDRYIESRKKSKWAIGRDYEMFIGHEYEQKGYKVTYTGITDRLEDKGRDLIAQKDNEILIIQCKNWSKYKEIHENHICQLFGTTVQYNIENNSLFKATPVFITSATLSETALKFAEYLGVQVIQNKKLEEFPRIKCNINNKEKIYHLPFDQQYDRTIIGDQKGEFFAWTVQEAVEKGFRRAKKYFYVKQ